MGDYFRRNLSVYTFSPDESWAILSPIAREVKRKVEANGVPLSEWGVEIYRGILTGRNDVFVISGETRDAILGSCFTEDERIRTAEIIRPILRGRDVKKYACDFADKWLINTHNGIKEKGVSRIIIDDYPSLKQYLDKHIEKITKRTDKGDTVYNLRNCAYMDNFSRPKIVWKRIGSKMRFCIDYSKMLSLDSTCFLVGGNLDFLNCFFNSKIGSYMLQGSPTTGTGDLLISVQAINPLCVPIPNEGQNKVFSDLSSRIVGGDSAAIVEANNFLYEMFGFTKDEKERIEQG